MEIAKNEKPVTRTYKVSEAALAKIREMNAQAGLAKQALAIYIEAVHAQLSVPAEMNFLDFNTGEFGVEKKEPLKCQDTAK